MAQSKLIFHRGWVIVHGKKKYRGQQSLYHRPVVFVGETVGQSDIFLPFSPYLFDPSPIVLVLVNGNHFNIGLLKAACLPSIYKGWMRELRKQLHLVSIHDLVREAVLRWERMFQ